MCGGSVLRSAFESLTTISTSRTRSGRRVSFPFDGKLADRFIVASAKTFPPSSSLRECDRFCVRVSLVDRRYFSGDRRLLFGLDPGDLSGNGSLAFKEREREREREIDLMIACMQTRRRSTSVCGDIVGVT